MSKRTVILATAVASAILCAPRASIADPLDWSGYKKSFNITFSGYEGTETLTDFPVLIRLSAEKNEFQYRACRLPEGGDLRFSDAAGNLLDSEVDTWNENGESLVWVKVPSLNATTMITAHYGNSSPVAVNATNVWSNGYVGVWHLGESARPLKDSSANAAHFTVSATVDGKPDGYYDDAMAYASDGLLGKAVALGKRSDKRGGLRTDGANLDGFPLCTIEFWTLQTEEELVSFTNAAPNYVLSKYRSSSDYAYQFSSGSSDRRLLCTFKTAGVNPAAASALVADTWVYSAYTVHYDAENTDNCISRAFFNGNMSSQFPNGYVNGPSGPIPETTAGLVLGNRSVGGDTRPFPGTVDELRISNVDRSKDWVKATYDTVMNADFAVFAMSNDWKKYSHSFSVTVTNAPATPLSAFPVLVKVSESAIPGFSYADCLVADGGDLRFSDENGDLLDSEVDTWNPDGDSFVWVKVPSLSASTTIRAYYGWKWAPAVNPKAVWTNGFVGVWHLNENARPLKDSTTNRIDFTASFIQPGKEHYGDSSLAFATNGIVGASVGFDMKEDGKHTGGLIAYDTEQACTDGYAAMTVEFWANEREEISANRHLLAKYNSSSSWSIQVYEQASDHRYASQFVKTDGGGFSVNPAGGTMRTLNEWAHCAYVYDSENTSAFFFLNGRNKTNGTYSPALAVKHVDAPLCIGNRDANGGTYAFPGCMDEVRISNVARSAAWVKATYNTVMGGLLGYSAARENIDGSVLIFR